MEPPPPSSGEGSRNSGDYAPEIADSLRFEEEIQSLIHPILDPPPPPQHAPSSPAGGGSSFTALLGLPSTQAVELLHAPDSGAGSCASTAAADSLWHRFHLPLPLPSSPPTFPSDAALVERAARFSVFAAAEGDNGPTPEQPQPRRADDGGAPVPPRPAKRKETGERSSGKAKAKRSKSAAAEEDTGDEKLPYVHVRARRGQATDSHSLAERARREKINARMKLLQELVPGCSKISGTALVLDEIINHVQYLQRQVEYLSMRLAAVNPRIDLGGLDSFLSAECGRLTAGSGKSGSELAPAAWSDSAADSAAVRSQQFWHVDLMHPHPLPSVWDRDPSHPLLPFHRPTSSASLHSNQLKMEL